MKIFNIIDLNLNLTFTLISLIVFALISLIYVSLIINYNKAINLNLYLNAIPLFVATLILFILYIRYVPPQFIKILAPLIISFSIHILVSYGKKHPSVITILRNKDNNPAFKDKKIKTIAIYGTIVACIGILLGLNLKFNLLIKLFLKLNLINKNNIYIYKL